MGKVDFDFDTTNLEALLRELPVKRRHRILQNALRKLAGKARKEVMAKVAAAFATRPRAGKPRKQGGKRAWGRKSAPRKDVAKGVQFKVYPHKIGFRVYIWGGNVGEQKATCHTNRQGKLKPVMLFASQSKQSIRTTRNGIGRKAANRGVLPQKPFLKTAAASLDPRVKDEFQAIMLESTRKIAAKYGAKLS